MSDNHPGPGPVITRLANGDVILRSPRDPYGPGVQFSREQWLNFINLAASGEYDDYGDPGASPSEEN